MNNNELMHFGIKGMKWGKRKTRYVSDLDKARINYKNAKRNRVGKETLKNTKTAYKQAKKENRQAINDAYKTIKKSQSVGSRMTYNDSVYKKAAKNMVNKGMNQKKAVSKAKMSAWRNVGMIVAGKILISNSDKIISGIQKYANQKAIQRANAGLARIGTMKLVKVAGNVYEYKMK